MGWPGSHTFFVHFLSHAAVSISAVSISAIMINSTNGLESLRRTCGVRYGGGDAIYRCVAAGVRQRTTACERLRRARIPSAYMAGKTPQKAQEAERGCLEALVKWGSQETRYRGGR